jgi:hypothetical protein
MDRVPTGTGGHALADAVVATTGEADAGHVVLGSVDEVVGPHAGQLADAVGSEHGVMFEQPLVADHGCRRPFGCAVLQPDLPERGVARQEGSVAAPLDETLDGVAHAR